MRKKIEYQDLKENEIYFCSYSRWSNDYIQRYNKDSYSPAISIEKGSGALVFVYSHFFSTGFAGEVGFYSITQEEKELYDSSIKANKLIISKKEEITNNFKYY